MSHPLDNLYACILTAAMFGQFNVQAPRYDAHVAAYYAERTRETNAWIAKQPPTPRWRRSNRC